MAEALAEAARILDQLCNRFDGDMNDSITWDEFGAALAAECVDEPTASLIRETVFQGWDANADRVMDLNELRRLATAWAAPPGDQS